MTTESFTDRRQFLAAVVIGALASAGSVGAVRSLRGRCDPLADASSAGRRAPTPKPDDGGAPLDPGEAREAWPSVHRPSFGPAHRR